MEEAIRKFPGQLAWEPEIENHEQWQDFHKFIICGMGGSHLQGDVFQNAVPGFDLSVHQDYGLPRWRDDVLQQTLIIVSSFSGNTEEALSAFDEAIQNNFPVAVISTGGELLIRANQHKVPFIQIPNTGIQPRSALGYTFKALAKMVGREDIVREATAVGKQLEEMAPTIARDGKELAEKLQNKIPVIYTSNKNYAIAYNWKIKFNETGKIPAFYNTLPELNHNEMSGFDVSDSTRKLCDPFHFILLQDTIDFVRVQKRMQVLERLLRDRGLGVDIITLSGGSMLDKIFSSLLMADWAALHTANFYGRDPEEVPMIEEFKRLIG